jgi:hypothetical protein
VATLEAVKIEARVGPDGRIEHPALTRFEGENVEIIVLHGTGVHHCKEYPLAGTVHRYDDPFGPACPEEDWEALRDSD